MMIGKVCIKLKAVEYVDGIEQFMPFNSNYAHDLNGYRYEKVDTIEVCTDVVFEILEENCFNEKKCSYDDLFEKIFNHPLENSPLLKLKEGWTEKERAKIDLYIKKRLLELYNKACETRQSIAIEDLRELNIFLADVPRFDYIISRYKTSWDDLDESDLRHLDPEGCSLISFKYVSDNAKYSFHLPYRIAEEFLDATVIKKLRASESKKREEGEYFGRAITEEEALKHPIEELLHSLNVDISTICPNNLIDKEQYIADKWNRQYYYNDAYEDFDVYDDFDDFDDEICKPKKSKRKPKKKKFTDNNPEARIIAETLKDLCEKDFVAKIQSIQKKLYPDIDKYLKFLSSEHRISQLLKENKN